MDTTCPSCSEKALLLWYAAGALTEQDRETVEQALVTCAPCQSLLAQTEILAQAFVAIKPVLSSEELTALASQSESAPSTLGEEDREIFEILKRVDVDVSDAELSDSELEPSQSVAKRLGGWWKRTMKSLSVPHWAQSPALVAYVLMAFLAYPAYLGLTTTGPAPAVIAAPFAIDATDRSDTGVRVAQDAHQSVITVYVPINDVYQYRLELVDDSGNLVFAEDDVRPFDGVGTIAVLLPHGYLDAGDYRLTFRETERDGSRRLVNSYVYPFEME